MYFNKYILNILDKIYRIMIRTYIPIWFPYTNYISITINIENFVIIFHGPSLLNACHTCLPFDYVLWHINSPLELGRRLLQGQLCNFARIKCVTKKKSPQNYIASTLLDIKSRETWQNSYSIATAFWPSSLRPHDIRIQDFLLHKYNSIISHHKIKHNKQKMRKMGS